MKKNQVPVMGGQRIEAGQMAIDPETGKVLDINADDIKKATEILNEMDESDKIVATMRWLRSLRGEKPSGGPELLDIKEEKEPPRKSQKEQESKPKSGYEIRLEILKMAKEDADNRWFKKQDVRETNFKNMFGDNPPMGAELKLEDDNRIDEALNSAEKLYAFVEQKR
jgi:hypothetical protein